MTTHFELWLHTHHYRPNTLRATARDVVRAREVFVSGGDFDTPSRADSLRRYATYLAEMPQFREPFDLAVLARHAPITRKKHPLKGPRKRTAVSFTDDEWHKLLGALSADDAPESRVLLVQALIGYRVGDVLGIQRSRLKTALRTGLLPVEVKGGRTIEVPIDGARDVWEGLYEAWPSEHPTMDAWVCPRGKGREAGGMGAYQRVNRHLKALGAELGIDSRLHSHRFRRTVGVHALKATRDIHVVQQLLGHTTIAGTQHYLDEIRRDDIIDLQRRLRENHG